MVRRLPDKQLHERPTAHMATETVRQSPGSVPMQNVQLILGEWHCAVDLQVCLHYAVTEESKSRSGRTQSFRPISNLSVTSKLLERLKQLLIYLKDNDLLPDLQSAYRAHHSTETAILRVLSDILSALDSGNLVMLTLLDTSTAFDYVDHHTLLQRLRTSYGLEEKVINWFTSYLSGRTQQICTTKSSSMPSAVDFWSPARFGPWTDLVSTVHCRPVAARQASSSHATRVCRRHPDGDCQPTDAGGLAQRVVVCISENSANRLQLNLAMTEVLWCASSRRQHLVPTASVVSVMFWCHRSPLFGTLVFTSTLMSP